MSVVFATFMCPGLDGDLLFRWIEHYIGFHFDRYHAILHVNEVTDVTEQTRITLMQSGFTTERITGEYHNGDLQAQGIGAFKATLDKNDTLVLADSDEFHDMPKEYRQLAYEKDYICGTLIDRWGDQLVRAKPGIPIELQYPYEGEIYNFVRDKYNLKNGNWEWRRQLTKVMAHKVRYQTQLEGNHFIIDPDHSANILDNQRIDHYTWRDGVIKRLLSRSYNPIWWTFALMNYFGIKEDSEDFKAAMVYHVNQQEERGFKA